MDFPSLVLWVQFTSDPYQGGSEERHDAALRRSCISTVGARHRERAERPGPGLKLRQGASGKAHSSANTHGWPRKTVYPSNLQSREGSPISPILGGVPVLLGRGFDPFNRLALFKLMAGESARLRRRDAGPFIFR